MAFKEKIKKFGAKMKKFWKEHWEEVVLVTGGVALTGAACYGMYKSGMKQMDGYYELENQMKDEIDDTIANKTAWNKDWDEFGCALEHLTHQPYGDMLADDNDYKDPLEGNCFIVAGYNSLYNDSPDQLKFYALDNEGWYHPMPDDVYSA